MDPRSLFLVLGLLLGLATLPACFATEDAVEEGCSDEADNDEDGLIDCEDADCEDDPGCSGANDDDSAR